MRVAVTGRPPSERSSWPCTSMPRSAPHTRKLSTLPAALRPKWKSLPMWMWLGTPPPKQALRKSSGLWAANSRENGSTTTASTSSSASLAMRASLVMSFFSRSAANTSSGSMSKVMTALARPSSRAVFTASPMMKRCPSWTPSKTPKATEARSSRASSKAGSFLEITAATRNSYREHAAGGEAPLIALILV